MTTMTDRQTQEEDLYEGSRYDGAILHFPNHKMHIISTTEGKMAVVGSTFTHRDRLAGIGCVYSPVVNANYGDTFKGYVFHPSRLDAVRSLIMDTLTRERSKQILNALTWLRQEHSHGFYAVKNIKLQNIFNDSTFLLLKLVERGVMSLHVPRGTTIKSYKWVGESPTEELADELALMESNITPKKEKSFKPKTISNASRSKVFEKNIKDAKTYVTGFREVRRSIDHPYVIFTYECGQSEMYGLMNSSTNTLEMGMADMEAAERRMKSRKGSKGRSNEHV